MYLKKTTSRVLQTKASIVFVVFIFALQLFISGCANKIDNDLVGSDGCYPPCWVGIEPGKTNKVEAIHLLEQMEIEKKGNVIVLDADTIKWLNSTTKRYYLYSENGIINKIKIDFRPVSTSLEEVILRFGDPNRMKLGEIDEGGYLVTIYYPHKGLVIVVSGNKSLYEVYPDMEVVFVYYLQPGSITDIESTLSGKDAASENFQNLKMWVGYGMYVP